MEEEPKEDGEEFEDLSAMLEHLGLSEYKKTFDEERIDIESFVRKTAYNCRCIPFLLNKKNVTPSLFSMFVTLQLMCTIEDLKEMGIPLGPRKKIAKFVKERVNKQVGVLADYLRCSKTHRTD